MTRPTTDLERQVFSFLNDLRDSGVTNMYGATPYIVEEFPEFISGDCRVDEIFAFDEKRYVFL